MKKIFIFVIFLCCCSFSYSLENKVMVSDDSNKKTKKENKKNTKNLEKEKINNNQQQQQQQQQQSKSLNDLKLILQSVKTYKGKFYQEIIVSNKEEIKRSSGFFYTKKPNFFRWEIKKPSESIIIINGDKIWNYDKDLEQVTIQNVTKQDIVNSAFFLSEDINSLSKNYLVFSINCLNENLKNSKKCFKLLPKDNTFSFQHLLLGFNKNILKELILFDQIGQITKIKFLNLQVNKKIVDNKFLINIPKGVDVVNSAL